MKNQDFLKLCMEDVMSEVGNVPIDEFNQRFCVICANKECARSSVGSTFNKRVSNWREDLFINPPRAKDDDPKFASFRSKHFLSIEPDPLKIYSKPDASAAEEPKIAPMIEMIEEAVVETPQIVSAPAPAPIPEPDPPVIVQPSPVPGPSPVPPKEIPDLNAPAAQPQQPQHLPQQGLPVNTPFQQGTLVSDKPEETIIESGGSYTFGGEE